MERRQRLERLIAGLKQSIESTRFELPYYKPEDLQLVYAKKFLAASEAELARAEKELESLPPSEKAAE
jgi:hypothetical protein